VKGEIEKERERERMKERKSEEERETERESESEKEIVRNSWKERELKSVLLCVGIPLSVWFWA